MDGMSSESGSTTEVRLLSVGQGNLQDGSESLPQGTQLVLETLFSRRRGDARRVAPADSRATQAAWVRVAAATRQLGR